MTRKEQINAIDWSPITDVVQWAKVELDIQGGDVKLVAVKETFKPE